MSGNHPKEHDFSLNSIQEAIQAIAEGAVIIVVDNEDRENEGDFICAAEKISPDIVNFMARHGRGLICTPIEESLADDLGLHMMVNDNNALHETAFTVSIDLIGDNVTTGISTQDRSACIKALVDPDSKPERFARPGHIFPLRAKNGGVLRRTGHTEAAVDLARMAGLFPAGVLVEILNEDGTMARLPQLMEIAQTHNLKIISIDDLVAYRLDQESLVEEIHRSQVETAFGNFESIAFKEKTTGDIHIAMKKGDWNHNDPILTRVHSSSVTGGMLGLLFKGYGGQLDKALARIAEEEKGIVLFMQHTDEQQDVISAIRGYHEEKKIDQNMDVQRSFGIGAQILRALDVKKLKLLTNNPIKRVGLIGYGLEIVETVKLG